MKFDIGTNEHEGYTITIEYDHDPLSPRTDYDNLGTMMCCHRNYSLGDVQSNGDEIREKIKDIEDKGGVWLPLYLYDHSGITMNTSGFSCQWDSGMVGIIYVEREKILKEYSCKRVSKKLREIVINVLKGEVEIYDYYIRGEVYGFTIEDENGNNVDSGWGFFGGDDNLDGMEYEILSRITDDKNDKRKEKISRLKTLIKKHVPLIKRQELLGI